MASVPTHMSEGSSASQPVLLRCGSDASCRGRISQAFVNHMARVKQVLLDKCQSTAPTEPTVRASLVRGSSWLESIRTAKANEMSSGTGRPVQFDADTTAEINGIRSSLMDLQSQVKTNMLLYEGLLIGARTCLEHEMELCEHLRRDYDPQSYMQGAQVQTYGDLMSEVIQLYE